MSRLDTSATSEDSRWLSAACALAWRARQTSYPNPNVACILVRDGCVVGRGWTGAGGRPHAEAIALAAAGESARGATAYVTLEPCAHDSKRGPACSALLANAGVRRVVAALQDPDPRTAGQGFAYLAAAGVAVCCAEDSDSGAQSTARAAMSAWLSRIERRRPFVTLKLALSLDGAIALGNGQSQWISGAAARRFVHNIRTYHHAILVGRGTWQADQPRLDVRLAGLEARSPKRLLLSRNPAALSAQLGKGWQVVDSPAACDNIAGVDSLLVEGGAGAAAAFLASDRVDRLLLLRTPIVVGAGKAAIDDIGLDSLESAHGRWHLADRRYFGSDILDIYDRKR